MKSELECSKRAMCVSLGVMREERRVGCSNSDGGDSDQEPAEGMSCRRRLAMKEETR